MYLVMDIGGTFVKYALMNSGGSIYEKGKEKTPDTCLEDMKDVLFSIIDRQLNPEVKGIAISCPGTVDVHTGVIYQGGNLTYLHEVNLAKIIEEKYGIPVCIENDAKCAALAELWLGSIKGCQNAIVLVLGTGVGGGLIIDGKLYRGANLSAGEVSYVMSEFNPVTKEAEFVGYSGSAVVMVNEIAKRKQLDVPDGKAVFELINAGDEEANRIFNKYCMRVAAQILNLQNIVDPERIAIGGGISAQPVVLERLNWAIGEIKKQNWRQAANPNIVVCEFLNDANIYGALYNFFVLYEEQEKEAVLI